jgi:hypothetical protein
MCFSAATMMAVGQIGSGLSGLLYADTQAQQMKADAAGQRDASKQQAQHILRETQRRRAAARAATAASGARIDQFSLANEQEIVQAGETDAAMEILSGERRARGLETGSKLQRASGLNQFGSSLFAASSSLGNWRGAKYTGTNDIPGVNGSNAMDSFLRYGKGGD